MKKLILAGLMLLSASQAGAWVYSIDGLIDVERMAVDKMYYDLYYNPDSKLFERDDAVPLSPEAEALVQKATGSKVDRAISAEKADQAEYVKKTGENACVGDPYVGSGTDTVPEMQSPSKPGCLKGGAQLADENIGYVYKVDRALKATNAKEAMLKAFRAKSFNNAVPRVREAPSADTTEWKDEYTVHDDDAMKWTADRRYPVGMGFENCSGTSPDGSSCFKVVNDGAKAPDYVDDASWADRTMWADMLYNVDLSHLTIMRADLTLNTEKNQNIQRRNYTFLINNYTVTKKGIRFCPAGWGPLTVPGLDADYTGYTFCGSPVSCGPEPCTDLDTTTDPPTCKRQLYNCSTGDICWDGQSCSDFEGSISVSDYPQSVTISLAGTDTRLEPGNLAANVGLVYQAAEAALPGQVMIGDRPIGSISACNGTPEAYNDCR